jgi:hypothetical protein
MMFRDMAIRERGTYGYQEQHTRHTNRKPRPSEQSRVDITAYTNDKGTDGSNDGRMRESVLVCELVRYE